MKRLACTLIAVTLGSLWSFAAGPQEPTDADYDWVAKVEKRAFEVLMPLSVSSGQGVAYRSDHDFMGLSEMERHFTIRYEGVGPSSRLSATVVAPSDRSIQRQLLALHMADRAATFEAILPKIAVSRWSVDSSNCPALPRQMKALLDLEIKVPPPGRFVSHPIYHRFVVRVSTLALDVRDDDETSPVVRWAIQTNSDLIGCGRRLQVFTLDR